MRAESRSIVAAVSVTCAVAVSAGCAGPARVAGTAPLPAAPSAAAEVQASGITGKVAETMDGGPYTYVLLEQAGGKKTWFAVPAMQVTVGETLSLASGSTMTNFASKSLNRTFDEIIFSSGPVSAKGAAQAQEAKLPSGHPSLTPPPKKQVAKDAKGAAGAAPNISGKVLETMESGGYTYACVEIEGKKTWVAFPPTPVAVGDVIEILPGIEMGKFTSRTLNRTFDNIIFTSGIEKK